MSFRPLSFSCLCDIRHNRNRALFSRLRLRLSYTLRLRFRISSKKGRYLLLGVLLKTPFLRNANRQFPDNQNCRNWYPRSDFQPSRRSRSPVALVFFLRSWGLAVAGSAR